MPLLFKKTEKRLHRLKVDPSRTLFPVAVTKMISQQEMRQIPEALEAMGKEFARPSGRCWIEKDRRSKQEVIAEAGKAQRKFTSQWFMESSEKKDMSFLWETQGGSVKEEQ